MVMRLVRAHVPAWCDALNTVFSTSYMGHKWSIQMVMLEDPLGSDLCVADKGLA